eukprot:g3938.t1
MVSVVTGGGSGIGRAICLRLARDVSSFVVVVDIDLAGAEETARLVKALGCEASAVRCDVSSEAAVRLLIDKTEAQIGAITIFVANAGIAADGGVDVTNEEWKRALGVNVMQHIYVARHMIPRWTARGSGRLIITASAAGLLTQLGSLPYSVTKHAAVSIAEWIAITHGDQGVQVTCLCPQGVRTAMVDSSRDSNSFTRATQAAAKVHPAMVDGMLEPEEVADETVTAMLEGRFLCLPHKVVHKYIARRAKDHDRWIGGMQRMQKGILAFLGDQRPANPASGWPSEGAQSKL